MSSSLSATKFRLRGFVGSFAIGKDNVITYHHQAATEIHAVELLDPGKARRPATSDRLGWPAVRNNPREVLNNASPMSGRLTRELAARPSNLEMLDFPTDA